MSADAELRYGWAWHPEDGEGVIPTHHGEGDEDEDEDGEGELPSPFERLAMAAGHRDERDWGSYPERSWRRGEDLDFDQRLAAWRAVNDPLGDAWSDAVAEQEARFPDVELSTWGHCEYAGWMLVVREPALSANYGPTPVPRDLPLAGRHSWDAQLYALVEALGRPRPEEPPGWFLVAGYG